jgi:hypothetical protein
MEKFTSALNTLDSLSKSFEIFIPSLNRKVKFKGLNTKQQKDAVKSALEKATAGVSFSLLLNSILRENIQEPVDLLLSDRSYIAVCLRVLSLSSTYKKENETVNLDFVLNNNLPLPTELKTSEIVVDNIKITAAIPSLSRDNSINIESKKKLAPLPDNDDLPKEAVGELYINELTKYIDKVDINNNGNVVSIVFDELNLAQKTQLVEKLPLTINTKLIEFINSAKLFEKGYFTNNGKEVDINIDPSLFTV